jgi:phage tail protein X
MAQEYITQAGDMVDAICYTQYGATTAYTEAVLAANPGLAAKGPILPAGLTITLPEFEEEPTSTTVKLWD